MKKINVRTTGWIDGLPRSIQTVTTIIRRTCEEFTKDQCLIRAASLSFSTLLAGIPLTAFIFSLLTAFGTFEEAIQELQAFIIEILMPTKQEELMLLIDQFVANSSALGVVGLVLFAITSINLLNNITVNLNALWSGRYRANFLGKFTTYTSVLIFGALLISASFTIRSVLSPIFSTLNHPLWSFFLLIIPTLLMFVTFLLLIMLVPATRIRPKYALIGSAVGVAFWEIAKVAFVRGTNYVIRASIMYGSMAAVVIFLFWLYIVWLIILGASELTYALQNRRRPWSGEPVNQMVPSGRVYLGLRLYLLVSEAFQKGKPPVSLSSLANHLGISLQDAEFLRNLYQDAGLIHTVGKDEWGLVPARSLEVLKMEELVQVLIGHWPREILPEEPLVPILHDVRASLSASLEDLTVSELLKKYGKIKKSPEDH